QAAAICYLAIPFESRTREMDMAAAALTPRVRTMVICDGVRESKMEVDVFHLKGVRRRIVANGFPFVPRRLWLFLVMSSLRSGEFPGYIRVINDRTEKAAFYAHLVPRPVFDGNDYCEARYSIRCRFPEEGRYTAQIWFYQQHGIDVLKGELPFTVV